MQPHWRRKSKKPRARSSRTASPSYGTDALRFTFARWPPPAATSSSTWAASRATATSATSCGTPPLCAGNCEGRMLDCGEAVELGTQPVADRWIISACNKPNRPSVDAHLDNYRFDLAAQALYEFIWNEYCDWYLELTKPVLTGDNASDDAKRGTRRTWCACWNPCCAWRTRSCRSSPKKSGRSTKLGNEAFTAKAPPEVIAKEQEKLDAARQAHDQLQQQQERIRQL
jgi:valyl-tRNA synthetase